MGTAALPATLTSAPKAGALKTDAELMLAEAFAAAGPGLPGNASIAGQRAKAFDAFAAAGLPHRRVEAWRYTDLRALMRNAAPLAAPPDAAAKAEAGAAQTLFDALATRRLVLVNGSFVPDLSDLAAPEAGLTITSLATALAEGDVDVCARLAAPNSDPMLALNTAFMGDGVVIKLAPGTVLARRLLILHLTAGAVPTASVTRAVIVVGAGAKAMVLESHQGPDGVAYQVNTALDLAIAAGGSLERVKVLREGSAALHVSSVIATLGEAASYDDFALTTGGKVVRNQSFVTLTGAGTRVHLHGATLGAGAQHTDTALVMQHEAPGCESREVFRAVLDGKARDAFQGRIEVRPQAQQTDARMMTRALLLSGEAEAYAKPELEIFADDVQCGHGCTTGALNDDLKFYLMARGIPAKEAEALLVQAFVGEAIDPVSDDAVREALTGAVTAWLMARE